VVSRSALADLLGEGAELEIYKLYRCQTGCWCTRSSIICGAVARSVQYQLRRALST
jgi:hypothetical protein